MRCERCDRQLALGPILCGECQRELLERERATLVRVGPWPRGPFDNVIRPGYSERLDAGR